MKIKIGDLTKEQLDKICTIHKNIYEQCYGCPLLLDYPNTNYLVCVRNANSVQIEIEEEILK